MFAPHRLRERQPERFELGVTSLHPATVAGALAIETSIGANGGRHCPTFLNAEEEFRRGKLLMLSGKLPAPVAEFCAAMEISREQFAAAGDLAMPWRTCSNLTKRQAKWPSKVRPLTTVGDVFWPNPNDMSEEPPLDREGRAF